MATIDLATLGSGSFPRSMSITLAHTHLSTIPSVHLSKLFSHKSRRTKLVSERSILSLEPSKRSIPSSSEPSKPIAVFSLSSGNVELILPRSKSSSPPFIFSPLLRKSQRDRNLYRANRTQEKQSDDRDSSPPSPTDISLVTSVQTMHSYINIVDISSDSQHPLAGARVMLLGIQGNPESIYYSDRIFTGMYWDDLASFVPLLPDGPIAILGLGGGTTARIIRTLWPSIVVNAWEIDGILVDMARRYMHLDELEQESIQGGKLHIFIDDALSPNENTPNSLAGIIIDLFSSSRVLSQLEEPEVWKRLKSRLVPNGRIIINCGSTFSPSSSSSPSPSTDPPTTIDAAGQSTAKIMESIYSAFPEEVNWRITSREFDANHIALTGPLPDSSQWSSLLPDELQHGVYNWIAYDKI